MCDKNVEKRRREDDPMGDNDLSFISDNATSESEWK